MTAAAFHEEWFCTESQSVLEDLVKKSPEGLIVEFGAWEGRSSAALANAAFPRIVHSVDPWDGRGHPESERLARERDIAAQWQANMDAYTKGNVRGHKMGWRDFVPTIKDPIGFCFIDADHSYREVFDNLAAVIPHLAPGAWVCGDDAHHGPVQDAVFDLLGLNIGVLATVWCWQMPADEHEADWVRLRAQSLVLAPTGRELDLNLDRIARLYRHYCGFVSPQDMAASPATCAYLFHLCTELRPSRVLDLGSGLSSAVLRKYQQERNPDCAVTSVDDDADWLDKTRSFLRDNELSESGLELFSGSFSGKYDLVFHDLAGGQIREDVANLAMEALVDGGIIVLDDAHRHADAYRAAARSAGVELFSLAVRLKDAVERYPMVGIKTGRVESGLKEAYERQCRTPSDIYLHLPRFVGMVEMSQATKVIELGTRTGVSTIAWLHALEKTGGHLWSVDLDAKPPIGDYPHWTYIQGNDEKPDVFDALPDQVDILFLDTSHHYEHTRRELELYVSKVKPGGVIVCHDTELPVPEFSPPNDPPYPVKKAITEFTEAHGLRWFNVPECWGLGIIEVT